ncbi:AsmA family protein [Legionella quateirensis]|uniref:AsmA protein n=1 Tax=Legionella quateirensis TaxID=45072 RepID=A0A378KV96_9GAMM|nr:AsmA family protein [Legionella quateirensis]KTD52600.1 putative asmA protein [Legionella quateirensis]STY18463.1 putative asmA protein [Legionella quateirensis]
MKLLGKTLLAALVLIIFAFITLWILAKNIKPETIKQLVSNQITALTHKKSQINGDIYWQVFPRPGLKFSKIQIGDEKIRENYFLSADTLLLNLQITPLLKGNFVFSEINVDGLKLQINQDIPQATQSSSAITPNKKELSSHQFAIQSLSVNHGQMIINNNGRSTVFKNIQIGIEQFNTQKSPFPVQIKARLTEAAPVSIAKANINFKGRLSLAPSFLNELHNGIENSSVEGQLFIQNILLNQFAISKLNTTIKTHKTGISFNPLTLSLYGGESIGDMDYKLANQECSLNQTATNLDGKQLMTALIGHEAISGNLDYSIHATVPLNLQGFDNINGKGTITIKDGEIYNINLNQMISNIKEQLDNLMKGTPSKLPKTLQLSGWEKSGSGNTPFKLANIQYQIQNEKITSESLLLQTDKLQVNGEGNINLSTHELNAKLKAILNSNSTDSSMQKIQQALGGYFPLDVSGTIEHPMVLPDIKMINPLLSHLLIKTTLEQPLKQIEGTLKEFIR